MGRPQVETQIPYPPPPPSPQAQPAVYYPQQQSHPHTTNHVINNPQQVSNDNVGHPLQYNHQQSSPVMLPQAAGNAPTASLSSFQSNAGSENCAPVQILTPPSQFHGVGVPWTTGLFDCMEDPHSALITAIFPCVTFGQIADVLDNGHTTCATSGIMYAAAPCLMSRPYRRKLRQRFGLMEAPAPDWFVHSMYEHCALCQEYRELKNRGIDPALGYHGDLAKFQNKKDVNMMVPPTYQTMNQSH